MDQQQIPDYYETLQVSRRSDPMMITRAYRLLVAFYHPDNKETGNEALFRDVLESYRVLSDPVRRAAYDRAKFGTPTATTNGHAGSVSEVSDGMPVDERQLRRQILTALYDVRRSRPYKPALPLMAIAELFGRSMEEIQFSLWYLRGKKWIEMPDGSDIAITIAGVDEVEAGGASRRGRAKEDALEPISLPARGQTAAGPGTERVNDSTASGADTTAPDRSAAT